MTRFESIEASRVARGGRDFTAPVEVSPLLDVPVRAVRYVRDDYAVVRVYDDGRKPVPVKYNLTHEAADREAGRMRDALSDAEVQVCIDEGWTYEARAMKGGPGGNVPRTGKTAKRGFIPRRAR